MRASGCFLIPIGTKLKAGKLQTLPALFALRRNTMRRASRSITVVRLRTRTDQAPVKTLHGERRFGQGRTLS